MCVDRCVLKRLTSGAGVGESRSGCSNEQRLEAWKSAEIGHFVFVVGAEKRGRCRWVGIVARGVFEHLAEVGGCWEDEGRLWGGVTVFR